MPVDDSIKAFVIDVDGTLTNGLFHVSEDGILSKSFHTLDFFAMNDLIKKGYSVLIITQSGDGVIEEKLASINASDIDLITGCKDKEVDTLDWMKENDLDWANIFYIGDAINDLVCMEKAGMSACPATIVDDVVKTAKIKAPIKGGEGAVYWIVQDFYKMSGQDWE